MKKSDLRYGDIVQTREGKNYIYLQYGRFPGDRFISLYNGNMLICNNYNEDLTRDNNKDLDIMKVCSNNFVGDNLRWHGITRYKTNIDGEEWTWVREEEKPKRYYLRFEGGIDERYNYLNRDTDDSYYFGESGEVEWLQTKFTEDEIADMPAKLQELTKVLVEEDN